MALPFRCQDPSCGEWVPVPDTDTGGQAECPACGLRQPIPLMEQFQAEAPAEPGPPSGSPADPFSIPSRPGTDTAPRAPDVVKRRGSLLWVAILAVLLLVVVGLIVGGGVWVVQTLSSFGDAQTAYSRGYDLEQAGRAEEAIAAYREAIRHNPKFFLAYYQLGDLLIDEGRPDEAVEALRKAAALFPEDADTQYYLGMALNDAGHHEEALQALNKALALGADDANTHFEIGHTYDEMGQLDRAIASYEEALRHDPELADAHWNIGLAKQAQGKLREAQEAFRRARQIDPGIEGRL
jgi:tetratricopeptide (TPR) repeat protein